MTSRAKWALRITLLAVLAIVGWVLVQQAVAAETHMHGLKRADATWYDGQCCSQQDCRQTSFREVERRDEGWFINSTDELILFNDPKIRRSLDPLIHICVMGQGKNRVTRCIYIPEMGG